MKRLKLLPRLPHGNFILSNEDLLKYEYISSLEEVLLFNRLFLLISKTKIKYHIKQYLFDYYLLGYSDIKLNSKEYDLIDLLDEYIELYLFNDKDEFYAYILAELEYNSLFNELIEMENSVLNKSYEVSS